MPDIDYHAVFRGIPGPCLLLSCDHTILDANDDFLEAVGRESPDVVGKNIFKAFPRNNRDPADNGPQNLRVSLDSVVSTCERDRMDLTRYDIEVPGKPGVFEERYWAVTNTPVLDDEGRPDVIVFKAEDATFIVRQVLKAQAVSG